MTPHFRAYVQYPVEYQIPRSGVVFKISLAVTRTEVETAVTVEERLGRVLCLIYAVFYYGLVIERIAVDAVVEYDAWGVVIYRRHNYRGTTLRVCPTA